MDEGQTVLLKTFATFPYPLETVVKACNTMELRAKWDKKFSNLQSIEKSYDNGVENEVYYCTMKMPLFITTRDWVLEKKYWKDYGGNSNCALFTTQSVEHSAFPETPSPVRANMIKSGQFFEELGPKETKLIMINHADIKMTSMISIVNKKAAESPRDFVENLTSGCKMIS